MRTLIVIPARLESTRLPRKLLLAETGKPLLAHVIEQAGEATVPDDLIVASANGGAEEITLAAQSTPYNCTDPDRLWRWPRVACTGDHPNGTSRAAQVALFADQVFEKPSGWWEAYCIVQADEPEIDPRLIDEVVQELENHPEWDCATAGFGNYVTIIQPQDASTSVVKAQITEDDVEDDWIAKDFSRDASMFVPDEWCDQPRVLRHIGIYAYRREALLKYAAAGPCQREQDESLEQLRALHIGLRMGVVLTNHQSRGIDTREDYDAFVQRWRSQHPEPQRT